MKIIHLKGFTQSEKSAFRAVIHNNILTSMHTITDQCLQRFSDQLTPNIKVFNHFFDTLIFFSHSIV